MRRGLWLLSVVLVPVVLAACGVQGEDEPVSQAAAPAGGTVTEQKYMCGDGYCNGNEPVTCPQDCADGYCGDGSCNGNESYATCPSDCSYTPPPNTCGNGTCDTWNGESSATCPQDCGTSCIRQPCSTPISVR